MKAGVNESSAVSPKDMILSPVKTVHVKDKRTKKGSAGYSAAPRDIAEGLSHRESELSEGVKMNEEGEIVPSDPKERDAEKSRFMDAEDSEDEEEEKIAARVRVRMAPHEPSMRERIEHEATHIPYRSWCVHCVRGRGRNTKHLKSDAEDQEPGIPRVSMDYFFLSQPGEVAAQFPMFVMIDEDTSNRSFRSQ